MTTAPTPATTETARRRIQPPICNATITGPIVKDRGRSRPLWRRGCRRRVTSWGDRCYQHREDGKR